ncbi:MAG: MATE family efflux transporter [Muribaculaceae bacterium]|nr:MATE family efflux transporter [Muribaculaceae bacterium]
MKHRREIFAIALPAIISNLTTPVLGLVDVAITGHIGAAVYIGAIAIGGTIFNMLYWLFGFLRMGTSGLTAQAYGARDSSTEAIVLCRSLLIAVAVGLLMLIFSAPILSITLRVMGADAVTTSLAARYFSICIWGAPAVMISYAISGWFIGMQDSKSAMWTAITTNLTNIAVSAALVFGLQWKIEGVATGTLVAQWAGAALALLIVVFRYRPKTPPLRSLSDRKELLSFFRINVDIFFRTCCLVTVTVWFTHAGAIQTPEVLAANTILMQFFLLFSYFIDGFAYAGEALAGKYVGAGDNSRLVGVVASLLKSGLRCALVVTLIYFLFGEWFISILADDATVVETTCRFLPWAIAVPLCGFLAFIWDGVFIGLVATRRMLFSMLIAVGVFFSLYYILFPTFSNNALWLAFNAYLIVRGLMQWLYWTKSIKP